MGHDLYRMVRAAMPKSWNTSERLVALILADICNDRTRRPPPGLPVDEQLALETGLGESALSHVLSSLARKGCELRVPLGTDKHGRPVYAAKGHSRDYRFPLLPPREAEGRSLVQALESKDASRCDQSARSSQEDASYRGQRLQDPATPNPKKPNTPNDLSSPDQEAVVSVITTSVEGPTADLAARLAKYIPDSEAS